MILKTTFLALALLASTAANATDFATVLVDLKGAPILDKGPDGKEVGITLGQLSVNALLASYPDEQTLAGTEKVKRFQLAMRISAAENKDIALTTDETEMVKKLVAKIYGPLVVGRVWEMLDPASLKR